MDPSPVDSPRREQVRQARAERHLIDARGILSRSRRTPSCSGPVQCYCGSWDWVQPRDAAGLESLYWWLPLQC
jgi:hypothetical protein